MAHIEILNTYLCATCRKKATHCVINDRSAVIGYYCARHAEKALEAFKATRST